MLSTITHNFLFKVLIANSLPGSQFSNILKHQKIFFVINFFHIVYTCDPYQEIESQYCMGAQTGESTQSTLHPHSQSSDLSTIQDPVPRPNFLSHHPQPHALFNLQVWVRMHILCLCTIPASYVSLILQFKRTISNTHMLCSVLAYCVHIRCKTNERSPYAHILSQKKILKIKAVCSL